MKSIFTVVCILFSAAMFAQTIPNSGFETWSQQGPFMLPTGWGGSPGVLISSDAHSGNYAVECKVDTFTNPQTKALDTVPSTVYTGSSTMGPPKPGQSFGGYAFTAKPDTFKGYYKFTSMGSDSFRIIVNLCHWNTTTNKRDIVARTMFSTNTSVSSYTAFAVKLNYISASNPDTCFIQLLAADPRNGIHVGTALWVDDISFSGGTTAGISTDSYPAANFSIVPNPASDFIQITCAEKIKEARIYDMSGRVVLISNESRLDISGLNAGMYLLRVWDASGYSSVQKLIKAQ